MAYHFTGSNASSVAIRTGDIVGLMPEEETVPGRTPETENDLSKWKLNELGQQIFLIGVQYPVEGQQVAGQAYEPYPEEAVNKMLPYIAEIGKRCGKYLENPEYSAEVRPVLNAYLRDTKITCDMCTAGLDYDRFVNENCQAGHIATLQLMDTIRPKTDGLSKEERKEALDAYENKAKEGPFFDLIHKGLDHKQITGDYEIARKDEKHPITVTERADFEGQTKKKLNELLAGIQKVNQCMEDPGFKLEDYPYMNSKTVENLKETRGLPNGESRALRERALLEGGGHIEEYQELYKLTHLSEGIKKRMDQNYHISCDPNMQVKENLMEWMNTLDLVKEMTDGLDKNPDKMARLKEDLGKQGITPEGYKHALQERLIEGAEKLQKDPTLTDKEREFYKETGTTLREQFKAGSISKQESEKANTLIDTRVRAKTDKVLETKKNDLELDRALEENGYGIPQKWQPKDNTELLTEMDVSDLLGASVKMEGIVGERGARYVKEFPNKTGTAYACRNGAYMNYGMGNAAVRQYSEAAFDQDTGKVIHPAEDMRSLLRDMNRDAREAMKETPVGNRMQRAMQSYVECLTREALDHKEPSMDRTKDPFMHYANGLWANITEPGNGKNLSWQQVEKLDNQFGLGRIMQDCVSMHEIFRSSTQRETAGIVDPAKEQKERELYGKLLDRVEKTADRIQNTPEKDRNKIAGLYDSTNRNNAAIDIYGKRGIRIAADTAREYREGLNKGWPIHEIPVYAAATHYAENVEAGLALLDPDKGAGMKRCLNTLKESLGKDIGGMNEKQKADYFKGLSDTLSDLNRQKKTLLENTGIDEKAREKMNDIVSTGRGTGRRTFPEVMPDLLTQAAQNSMKRAVTLGQARPQELAGLQTTAQRNALEDATLMMNRAGEAYSFVSKAQFKYQQMYKDLQSLKKKGESNSEYFQNMENALKTLSGMDGKKSPAQLSEAYEAMENAAQTYVNKRSGIHLFSGWDKNGKDRKNLAANLAEQARQDKAAFEAMIDRDDRIPEPKTQSRFQDDVRTARNGVRGPLNAYESLESQFVRYSNAVEQYRPPKLDMEKNMQNQKDAGALNAMKQKQEEKAKAAEKESKKETKKEAKKEPKQEVKKEPVLQQNNGPVRK